MYKYPDESARLTLPRTVESGGLLLYTARMSEADLYARGYKRILDKTECPEGMRRAATYTEVDTGERIERVYDLEPIPGPDVAVAYATKQAEIRDMAEAILAPLKAEYGPTEIATWDQQYSEALAFQTDAQAAAPLVRAIAAARGMEVSELVERIVANRDAWMQISGYIVGKRLAYQDQLDAAYAAEDVAAILAITPVYELPEI